MTATVACQENKICHGGMSSYAKIFSLAEMESLSLYAPAASFLKCRSECVLRKKCILEALMLLY